MKPDDDLERWMEALAGRGDLAEGQRLGRALRAAAARREAEPVRAPSAAELLSAAAEAGLLERPGCALCRRLAAAWRALGASRLALAAVALLALGVLLPRAPAPDEGEGEGEGGVLRGSAGPVLLRDAEPLARRERLANRLQAAGVQPRFYERLGRAGLHAEFDPAQRAALGPLLAAEGLAMPADGVLDVEIEAPR